jgi:4-hydroxy 2-oxovalerate aldolase
MYRPEIIVVDCTIRDGGLMNNSKFPFETVRAVYKAVCDSGVDIVELGYRNSKEMLSPEEYGPWRFCDDEELKKVIDGIESETKLAVMMDAHKSTVDDIKPKEQSPVDIIRVATYVKDVDTAIKTANVANENGYETTINIMAISHAVEWELEEALAQIEEETKVLAVYIVDSFGALYSEDIDFYYDKYRKHIKNKEVGVHCHNHQQLAFANTIQGIIKGANYVDGTLFGIGRAAGNCPLELLMSFLKNPKFDIRPIIDVIGKYIMPLQKEITWGYNIPYMIAGILNLHPRDAMEFINLDEDDPEKLDYRTFYEKCLDLI